MALALRRKAQACLFDKSALSAALTYHFCFLLVNFLPLLNAAVAAFKSSRARMAPWAVIRGVLYILDRRSPDSLVTGLENLKSINSTGLLA